MANLDTAAKRAAGLAVGAFLTVLPIPDGSNADSIAQRGHLVNVYAFNVTTSTPFTSNSRLRVRVGHSIRTLPGHGIRTKVGHGIRVVDRL